MDCNAGLFMLVHVITNNKYGISQIQHSNNSGYGHVTNICQHLWARYMVMYEDRQRYTG